jgi:hypothetical protein
LTHARRKDIRERVHDELRVLDLPDGEVHEDADGVVELVDHGAVHRLQTIRAIQCPRLRSGSTNRALRCVKLFS